MDNRRISKTITIFLFIGLIISGVVSVTYSIYSSDIYAPNPEVYSTGILSIEVNSKTENISLTNTLPMTDEEGLMTTPYIFTVKNTGNTDYQFDVKLLSTNSNTFNSNYIKLQIDGGDIVTLSSLVDSVIKNNIVLPSGKQIEISIRIWLDINTKNTELGKSFESKIVIDGKSIVNSELISIENNTGAS